MAELMRRKPCACASGAASAFLFFACLGVNAAAQEESAAKPSYNPLAQFSREDSTALRMFASAGKLFSQGKYLQAAALYGQFLGCYSDNVRAPDAREMLAECLYRSALAQASPSSPLSEKSFRNARRAFEKAAGAAPKGDFIGESAEFRLAEIEFDLKRYDKAEESFEALRRKYPTGLLRGEARLLESQALLAQNKSGKAASLLGTLLAEQPAYEKDSDVDLAYGIALFEIGESSRSLSYLSRLQSPLSYLYSGRAYLDLGKPLLAVEEFKKVKSQSPEGSLAEAADYLTAESFFVAKDYVSALSAFKSFIQNYPTSALSAGANYKIGFSQFERDDFLAARGSFQSVLQMAPKSEFAELALYMTGESFLKEKRFREAQFSFSDMASAYSDKLGGEAQFKLGWCLYNLQDYGRAQAALNIFLSRYQNHPDSPAAALLLGNVRTKEGMYAQAVAAYQRSLDLLSPAGIGEDLPGFSTDESRSANESLKELREADLALLDRASLMAQNYSGIISGYQYLLKSSNPTMDRWRAAALLYTAEASYRKGLYGKALKLFKTVLDTFPASPEAAYAADGMAWCLFQQGSFAQAIKEWSKISEYKNQPPAPPSDTVLKDGVIGDELFTDADYARAAAQFNKKEYEAALSGFEAFEKAHPQSPFAPDASLNQGWCYYRLQYFGQAIKTWERTQTAYKGSGASKLAAWATADTYFRAQKYDQAVAAYQKILTDYPDDPAANFARLKIAECAYNAKDSAKAISEFSSLISQAPSSPEAGQALDFLTQLLARPESKDAALAALKSLTDSMPNSSVATEAKFRVAQYYYENSNYAEAAPLFEAAVANLSLGEEMMDAEFALADCYYNLKNYKDAASAYERVIANYQGDKRYQGALFRLGASLFKTESFAKAAKAFDTLALKYPKSKYAPIALFNAALAFRKAGLWERASLAFSTYIQKYPEQAKGSNASDELISIYERHHQYDQAQSLLVKELENASKGEAAAADTYRLAQDYSAAGNDAQAEATYLKLRDITPRDNQYRLSALAKLADLYEKRGSLQKAIAIYDDMAGSSSKPEWRGAASERAAALRAKLAQSQSGSPAGATASTQTRTQSSAPRSAAPDPALPGFSDGQDPAPAPENKTKSHGQQ